MAYATVFLPAPGVAMIAAMGAVFDPCGWELLPDCAALVN
jgi:hypothetical protein